MKNINQHYIYLIVLIIKKLFIYVDNNTNLTLKQE
jgi:hypothetical protein